MTYTFYINDYQPMMTGWLDRGIERFAYPDGMEYVPETEAAHTHLAWWMHWQNGEYTNR